MEAAIIKNILDLARFAPSGDNMQTWRFEIIDERHFVIHAFDTRDFCVYDLRGKASQIAFGTLIETIVIAASGFQLEAEIIRRKESFEDRPIFDVFLRENASLTPSPLIPFIKTRTTQRRILERTAIPLEAKKKLELSLGPDFEIKWIESSSDKFAVAQMMWLCGKIRLTMPEAFKIHQSVIEKDAQYSIDRIPDQAVGLDSLSLKVMHWVMKSWERTHFFNTFLAGTLIPRLELDFLPSFFCGAHFVILSKHAHQDFASQISTGQAVARFWLTADSLNLQFQPEMSPLIFSSYIREGVHFTNDLSIEEKTQRLEKKFRKIVEPYDSKQSVFFGRLGFGSKPKARSMRKPLETLLKTSIL